MPNKLLSLLSIVLIIALATISGCVNSDNSNTPLSRTEKNGDIVLTMELEKTAFTEDDNVNIVVTLTNNGNKPITVSGESTFDMGITFPEGSVTEFTYLNPGGFIEDGEIVTAIEPGKSIVEEINWDQTYSTPDDEETIIEPGEYKLGVYVKAKITGENISIEPYNLKTETITITIE